MKVFIARTDGTREIKDIVEGTLLYEAQQVVGGTIDIVNVNSRHLGWVTIFVNDEGLLIDLDMNAFASALTADGDYSQVLVGDVLIAGGVDGEGNTLGLTDFQANNLARVQVVNRHTGEFV